MRSLVFILSFFSTVVLAQNLTEMRLPTSPAAAKSCKLKLGGRGYYLNLCPSGTVMVGVNPLPGNPGALQILCAQFEVVCE